MSVTALRWVLEHAPRHRGRMRAALFVLAWHADDQGENAWPARDTWARESGQSERSLGRAIRELEHLGHWTLRGELRLLWHTVLALNSSAR